MYSPVANEGWIGIDDHSKWAVSLPLSGSQRSKKLRLESLTTLAAAEQVACFGDLNREASQVRTLCMCTIELTLSWAIQRSNPTCLFDRSTEAAAQCVSQATAHCGERCPA